MKFIYIFTLTILLFSACSSDVKTEISQLEQELIVVQSAEEEKEILDRLWEISYLSEDIDMGVRAIDSEGNSVINNLSEAKEPISVIISFYTSFWQEEIEFEPLDIENVYLLLRE